MNLVHLACPQKAVFWGFLALLTLGGCSGNATPTPSTDPDFGISEDATGRIVGTVYDADTNTAIGGVSIAIQSLALSATTGADGAFELKGILPGTYDLWFEKDGYPPLTRAGIGVGGGTVTTLTIKLPKNGGAISGSITSSQKTPLSKVTVSVVDEETGIPYSSTTSDTSGAFAISGIPDGDYTLLFIPSDPTTCRGETRHLKIAGGTAVVSAVLSSRPPEEATDVGSASCATCHATHASTYNASVHATVLKTPDALSEAALSAFQASLSVPLTAGDSPVEATLSMNANGEPQIAIDGGEPHSVHAIYGGNRWKENYLTTREGSTYVLPVALSVATGEMRADPEEVKTWIASDGPLANLDPARAYEARCVGCHVSGFEARVEEGRVRTVSTSGNGPYLEGKIGCERCHGAGSAHVTAAKAGKTLPALIVNPRYLSFKENLQVCGQCHSKGHASNFSAATLSYPVDSNGKLYRPGDDLDSLFTPDGGTWSDGDYSREFHQEYNDYLGSIHANSAIYNPRCSDCHEAHGTTDGLPSLLKYPVKDNSLCLNCHRALNFPTEAAIRIHTQHPYDPENTGASRCVGCHLTKTGTLAEFGDVGGHRFRVVTPPQTLAMLEALEADGTPVDESDLIPNPCMVCHNALRADAELVGTARNVLAGTPTDVAYLTLLSEAYTLKFEEAKPERRYISFGHQIIPDWMDKSSPDHHGRYYLADPATCTNACHGAKLEGGKLSDGSAVPSCFKCHYAAPHAKRLEIDQVPDNWTWKLNHKNYYSEGACTLCHGEDYKGGIAGVSCYKCHSAPGVDFTQFQVGCAAQDCHKTPPDRGVHERHYNGNYREDVLDPQYGDTTNYSTPTAYRFGCGTCHPVSQESHRNGRVEVELYNEHAPANTMKAKMAKTARFEKSVDPQTGETVGTCADVYCHSYTQYVGAGGGKVEVPFPAQFEDATDPDTNLSDKIAEQNGDHYQTISSYFIWNNYASPENEEEAYYWSLPSLFSLDTLCTSGLTDLFCEGGSDENGVRVIPYDTARFGYPIQYPAYEIRQVRRYPRTPNWFGDYAEEHFDCNGCHSFPPRTLQSQDQWSASDPNWDKKAPTIDYEAAIDKHSFVFSKLSADGTTREVGHMANMSPFSNSPLRCQVCHYQTVEKKDFSAWDSGEGWSKEDGLVKIDNLDIDDKTAHVNGKIDVVFDTGIATAFRFNNTLHPFSIAPYPDSGDFPTYEGEPYYYGLNSEGTPGASWDPKTKTCSDVSCHLEQTSVTWNKPYRPSSQAECYQCHQYKSNIPLGEDETLCWPHAPQNGCDE